jgi:hypothetical protein
LARNGGGYGPGCHHHLSPDQNGVGGLEVLCRAHHAQVTAAQAKARAAARAKLKATETKTKTKKSKPVKKLKKRL